MIRLAKGWKEKASAGGARRNAVKISPLVDIPGDLQNPEWRVERRFWKDGSSFFHAVMWGQLENGTWQPWWPLKMIQVPWEDRKRILGGFLTLGDRCPPVEGEEEQRATSSST